VQGKARLTLRESGTSVLLLAISDKNYTAKDKPDETNGFFPIDIPAAQPNRNLLEFCRTKIGSEFCIMEQKQKLLKFCHSRMRKQLVIPFH